jgi:hypothetical protein
MKRAPYFKQVGIISSSSTTSFSSKMLEREGGEITFELLSLRKMSEFLGMEERSRLSSIAPISMRHVPVLLGMSELSE